MAPIDDALAEIESQESGKQIFYAQIARNHGVVRSMLTRRHKAQTRSRDQLAAEQQTLSPQQEYELVLYIERLTKDGLPPTRAMIQNFASRRLCTGITSMHSML
jgi:transposase-like protein